MKLKFRRKKITPYYAPCQEIMPPKREKDRYIDAATSHSLKMAKVRAAVLGTLMLLPLLVLWGRLFHLTVLRHENTPRTPVVWNAEEELARYNIVDRNGTVLATTLTSWDISVNPSKVKNPEEVAKNLANALVNTDEKELLEKLTANANFRYIKRGATPKELEAVNWLGYHFLTYEVVNKRAYPHGPLFSHILGKTDIDGTGIAGLEKAFNNDLQTKEVQLSLDTSVQEMVRTNLQKGIQKYKAEGGLGLVMDIHTGEVLASVSLPDYDPEKPVENAKLLFNGASLGVYEFGSVFKLFNTAMAFENKVIKLEQVIDASKPFKVGRKMIEDFRGQNRPLTITEILMHSSNIGSAKIALEAGYEKQRAFFQKMHLYEKLPIPLPERGTPIYNAKEKWAEIESATAAYGYGIAVTPLHLIAGVAALTNGGLYNVPTFLKDGNKEKASEQVLDEKISANLRQMMWAVVNWDPWAPKNPAKHYAVGGKTGTANMTETSGYDTNKQRTTFVGVFPVNNPKYAVLVTLMNPKAIKETHNFSNAGWNAKPVGLNIIAEIAPYLNVAPVPDYEPAEFVQKSIDISLIKNKRKKE